jgi:hypothetical protein
MALQLYAHPFSSYCQKALWRLQRMPVLVDAGRAVSRSSPKWAAATG